MFRRQMPFQFTLLSSSDPHTFKDGQIISTFNKCGLFFCRKGNVEVSLEDKHFQINPGDVYIYMASTLVHLLHKSEDAEEHPGHDQRGGIREKARICVTAGTHKTQIPEIS